MGVDELFETFIGDAGVDLGGVETAVAEHGLDAAQVGTVFDKVAGEGVAQVVWA